MLSKSNLTWLPESLGRLSALLSLRLSDNRLKALPESLTQLTTLRDLYLNGNQLTQVPSALGSLRHLARLDLSHNQLTALPAEPWGNLQKLYVLDLQFNRIAALPESIGQLRSLNMLNLNHNKLRQLPDSIGQMQSLLTLELNHNQLQSLPPSLGHLDWLAYLKLGFNELETLPSLDGLKGLYYFFLQENRLKQLPESIGALEQLVELILPSNQLTYLPESIVSLQSLMTLILDNNQLKALPASMGNGSNFKHLHFLSLASNRLRSLPESFGNLKLARLRLDGNRLTSIPPLRHTTMMWEFRASRNQLTVSPVMPYMPQLTVLSLHNNRLDKLSKGNVNMTFPNLQVALLHSNQLSDPLEICKFGGDRLKTLYLHGNRLRGEIPSCFSHFQGLEVLTLHRNALHGPVPGQVVRNLNVLTLHGNRLQGQLPNELTAAPKLLLFSAHSNRLVGSIPALKLLKDCVDDESFVKGQLSCQNHPYFERACDPDSEVAFHCPKTCGFCSNASARGPVLLLHNNRLSCGLPEEVTSWPEHVRSISLVGNMLGNGSSQVPQWIQRHERQPYLYVSGERATSTLKKAALLAAAFATCWLFLFGTAGHRPILAAKAGSELTRKNHIFLFQLGGTLTVLAILLLVVYFANATYYECSNRFSSATLSHFSNPEHSEPGHVVAEWLVSILWALWIAVGALFLRYAPGGKTSSEEDTAQVTGVARVIYSFCWLCIVVLLSFPSIVYALVGAIPHNNTLHFSTLWLKFFHYQAATWTKGYKLKLGLPPLQGFFHPFVVPCFLLLQLCDLVLSCWPALRSRS
eukprot:Skav202147  [mRNA]  locus=scaffold970:86887:89304:- [translate_table: standard]